MNNFCGLGFNGFDENGRAKWNRMTIVNILKIEVRLCVCSFFSLSKIIGFYLGFLPFSPFPSLFFQFATSLKEVLDNWNICTVLWLRRYVVIFLLIEWEGRTGKYLARGHNVHFRFSSSPLSAPISLGRLTISGPPQTIIKGPHTGGFLSNVFR